MRALPFLALGLIQFLPNAARASEAAFSADGKTLRVISIRAPMLLSFKTGETAPVKTPFPKAMGGEDGPSQLLVDPQGLLITAAGKLWQWNPADAKAAPKALVSLPPKFAVMSLARAEGEGIAGMILISGFHTFDTGKAPKDVDADTTLYGLKPGAKAFRKIYVRRLERITACPCFTAGRMIFGGDNDLWEGGLTLEDDSYLMASLWGHRTAPLGMFNTDSGNSGGMGVRSVAVAGGTVWASLGGHLMGDLVSVPLSKTAATDEHPELADAWKIQAEALAHAKSIQLPAAKQGEEADGIEAVDALCSWNGDNGDWKVAFRVNRKDFWMMEKSAPAPKKIGEELPREGE